MKKILAIISTIILNSCTYSITMVHTNGQATDVVDEQQTPTADIKATIPVAP